MSLPRAASLKANCLIQAYGLSRHNRHETAPPSRKDTKSFDSLRIQIAGSTISLLSSYYETIQKVWVEFRRFGKFGRLSMLRVCIFKPSKPLNLLNKLNNFREPSWRRNAAFRVCGG